jgi:hypothetical protein
MSNTVIFSIGKDGMPIYEDMKPWEEARNNLDKFAERFGVQKPEARFATLLTVPMGTILVNEAILPIGVVVNFFDGTTVWVRIGKDYPPIPFLEQYDDPIITTYDEAIEFVLKVKDTVKRTPWLFVKSEDESDVKSEDESDYKSEDESEDESDAKPDTKPVAKPVAKPVIKYPETNAGYEAWVNAKKEAEKAAEREAVIRGKSTTVVHVVHWQDSTIYNFEDDGKKFFLTRGEALKWAEEHFAQRDLYDESWVNTGKWKIIATDERNIVEFDPFFWDYNQFGNQEEDLWSNKIDYNYNDDDFYTPKGWDNEDEEKEIAKAIAKILRSKAYNLGLALKLSMKKCGMFDD